MCAALQRNALLTGDKIAAVKRVNIKDGWYLVWPAAQWSVLSESHR